MVDNNYASRYLYACKSVGICPDSKALVRFAKMIKSEEEYETYITYLRVCSEFGICFPKNVSDDKEMKEYFVLANLLSQLCPEKLRQLDELLKRRAQSNKQLEKDGFKIVCDRHLYENATGCFGAWFFNLICDDNYILLQSSSVYLLVYKDASSEYKFVDTFKIDKGQLTFAEKRAVFSYCVIRKVRFFEGEIEKNCEFNYHVFENLLLHLSMDIRCEVIPSLREAAHNRSFDEVFCKNKI